MSGDIQRYSSDGVRLIAGCVPINPQTNEVLLVTSRKRTNKWVLPKGGWNEGETEEVAAVRETWEEAGVSGDVGGYLGTWDHDKITNNGRPKGRLAFYLLKVQKHEDDWPESESRTRKYFPRSEAIKLVRLESMRHAIDAAFSILDNSSSDANSKLEL